MKRRKLNCGKVKKQFMKLNCGIQVDRRILVKLEDASFSQGRSNANYTSIISAKAVTHCCDRLLPSQE